ncbi:amidohydrolase family protein [Geomonas subterranea]|uniref:Amidohydrolase family protein n=1 Tax=Geomonas subterranea TaxID=2847989 RepID=A0ABX8LKE1_9BACT|nr:amidohydrolase family protein [Geomonas subterranea]QXE91317.1 amidohydrolase family protein [Geomonas subterranea]QXM10596.1 amidohydrolase family protein [Geomonas subterranea]
MPSPGEPKPQPLRIDFHVHLATYDGSMHPWVVDWISQSHPGGYEKYVARYSDPGAFEALLEEEGVDYACILAELNPVTTGMCSNDSVREFCHGRKRLIPFCDLNPHLHTDLGAELRRKVESEGFRGLKLYPSYQHYYLNEPRMYPLYQAAEELGIPVLIHTGSSVFKGTRLKYANPLHLDDVAVDFPSLNLVMAHSGRGFWYDRAFFLSRLHPNVYMELSGLPPAKLLTYFPELARNTGKTIFGSDWPAMPHIRHNMEAIAKLPLSPEGAAAILGGNAARILKLEGRS